MTNLNLIDYWWIASFAVPCLMMAIFLGVRFALDWRDHVKYVRREIQGERYGTATYLSLSHPRPNFRVGERR